MIDDFAIADPAEETLDLSTDMNLSPSEDSEDTPAAVFCAPMLDRIRTSD
ncbi:MAG: hypothetical protein NVV72_13105 [Asticcacaulis sp.]|nr:hypothetical protein [Asticcacaulis sp.]